MTERMTCKWKAERRLYTFVCESTHNLYILQIEKAENKFIHIILEEGHFLQLCIFNKLSELGSWGICVWTTWKI
jgi:uncharacterized radical SAM superfamily Fe-S cluster-containing enzyme